jgi:hypothetical protein
MKSGVVDSVLLVGVSVQAAARESTAAAQGRRRVIMQIRVRVKSSEMSLTIGHDGSK